MTRLEEFKVMLKAIDEAESWDAYPEYFEKLCDWYEIDLHDENLYPEDIYDMLVEAIRKEEEKESPAERIRSLRKLTGLSQTKFGEKYGIPMRTIQNWEAGANEAPGYVISLLERVVREDYPENELDRLIRKADAIDALTENSLIGNLDSVQDSEVKRYKRAAQRCIASIS